MNQTPDHPEPQPQETPIPTEQTNAYQAGYLAGYTKDNENCSPAVAGYMSGYLAQRDGAQAEEPAPAE